MISKGALLGAIAPPLDQMLADQLLSEYISQESRYVLGDWEPSTLDGGQFVEAASRSIYHIDSGNLNRRKPVDDCLQFIEDPKQQNRHYFPDRKASLHLCKVLRTIYKFRSDRGAIHIDPDYSANELDSKFLIEAVRWTLAEMLRIFWSRDRSLIAKTIKELIRYEIPVVRDFNGRLLVQRTDLSPEEEILILLHHAGAEGLNRGDIGHFVCRSPSSVTNALQKLSSSEIRKITKLKNGNYVLTDIGIRKVLNELPGKLRPQ